MQSFLINLLERIERPVTLQRLLAEHSEVRLSLEEPRRVISVGSVVRWNVWGHSPLRATCSVIFSVAGTPPT